VPLTSQATHMPVLELRLSNRFYNKKDLKKLLNILGRIHFFRKVRIFCGSCKKSLESWSKTVRFVMADQATYSIEWSIGSWTSKLRTDSTLQDFLKVMIVDHMYAIRMFMFMLQYLKPFWHIRIRSSVDTYPVIISSNAGVAEVPRTMPSKWISGILDAMADALLLYFTMRAFQKFKEI